MSDENRRFEEGLFDFLAEGSSLVEQLSAKLASRTGGFLLNCEAELAKLEFLDLLEADLAAGTPESLERAKQRIAALDRAAIEHEYGEI